MQAWLSSTVRHGLNIPPDSIVRIRRSVGYMLQKNAALLALPVAGLALAFFAIPGVPGWAWVGIPVVIGISLLPIRMPHGDGCIARDGCAGRTRGPGSAHPGDHD